VEKSNKSFKTLCFSFCVIQGLQLFRLEMKEIPSNGILAPLSQWDFCDSLQRGQGFSLHHKLRRSWWRWWSVLWRLWSLLSRFSLLWWCCKYT